MRKKEKAFRNFRKMPDGEAAYSAKVFVKVRKVKKHTPGIHAVRACADFVMDK